MMWTTSRNDSRAKMPSSAGRSSQNRKRVASLFVMAVYVLGLAWWAGHAETIHLATAREAWVALAVVVALLWGISIVEALVALSIAVVAVVTWSVTFVDFPNASIKDAGPVATWALVALPVALVRACVALLSLRRGAVVGATALLLGAIGTFPSQIANVDANVIGGWRAYPYPHPVAGIAALAILVALGIAGGMLGSRIAKVRRAISRRELDSRE